jgi:hypothetical protein
LRLTTDQVVSTALAAAHWRRLTDNFSGTPRNCRVPRDHVPRRSWPLFKVRAVLAGLLTSLNLENKP